MFYRLKSTVFLLLLLILLLLLLILLLFLLLFLFFFNFVMVENYIMRGILYFFNNFEGNHIVNIDFFIFRKFKITIFKIIK